MSRRRSVAGAGDLNLFGWDEPVTAPVAPVLADEAAEPVADAVVAAPRASRRKASARSRAAIVEPHAPAGDAGDSLDDIPGASPGSAVAVATLTQTAKDVLEGAFVPLWVRGEVSDFKAHRNGHWYFCLRDERAQLRCVMWARDRRGVPAAPDDGMQVVALGQLTVYPARGDMQFTVRAIEAQGDGLWRKALEATFARLDADGLLAPERKRALPRFPRRVAVVTSPDGAALHDILSVIARRAPGVQVVVVAAKVQGEGAVEEICAAIERAGRWGQADTLIVGRGGGAREDLWAFNDERVARAVAACPIPVISAVGHEVDVSICDLVADYRAATPSAAAEAAVAVEADAIASVRSLGQQLVSAARRQVARAAGDLRHVAGDLRVVSERVVERRRARMEQAAAQLHALSPLATLGRGYAVARTPDGETLSSARLFATGMPFTLQLRDGLVRATADAVERARRPGR